jgi:hypothetical protein
MPHPIDADFLVTDNGRARWTRRSEASGDFVTVGEAFLQTKDGPHLLICH